LGPGIGAKKGIGAILFGMVIVIEKKVSIGKDVEDLPIIEIRGGNENGKRTKICVGLSGGRIAQENS
jgi:hypothetical protein